MWRWMELNAGQSWNKKRLWTGVNVQCPAGQQNSACSQSNSEPVVDKNNFHVFKMIQSQDVNQTVNLLFTDTAISLSYFARRNGGKNYSLSSIDVVFQM